MLKIAVLGTFDTKGNELAFVANRIRDLGHHPILIDVGTDLAPTVAPDITREQILESIQTDGTHVSVSLSKDRGEAVSKMSRAASLAIRKIVEEHEIDGIVSLGGSGGTGIATAAMRALPIGFPKVMVSTLAGSPRLQSMSILAISS